MLTINFQLAKFTWNIMNIKVLKFMKVHIRVCMELHIDVYIKFTWEALKFIGKIIDVCYNISVHLCQLKIWKFTSKFAVNFTAEIAENAAFKAYMFADYIHV